MSFDQHTNFAYTTVDTAPTPAASGLSLTVATGAGALFPAAPFNAVVYPNGSVPLSTNAEIVRVTLVVGDVFTITRSQEGTSARTILAGDQIAAAITVKTLTDVETAIPSIAGLLSAVNVSAGATSNNLSALTFDNSNGVSFGLTGSVITATVATNYQSQGAYLTTAALSQDSSKYAGTNGAITGGSITVNTAGVSVDLPAYQTTGAYLTTAMASNRGSDFVQATAVFHGTNASGTIASGAISVSVAAAGAANINFSAGTTSNNLTQLSFKDTNGVSFGLNGGTLSATVKTDYQSAGAYLTTAALSQDSSKYAGTNGAITGGSITVNTSGVSVNLPAYLTTAMASNRGTDFVQATAAFAGTNASGTINSTGISVSVAAPSAASINISGGTTSSNLTALKFIDSQGVSWSLDTGSKIYATVRTDYQSAGAYLTTAALSQDSSKYAGTNGAITGGSITVNTSGVSVNLPAYLTTADLSANSSKYVQAWELTGNTAGTTSSAQGTKIYFEGGNSITVSGNSNTVKFSVGNYLTTADLSANSSKYIQAWEITGNTAGTTSSAQGTKIYFEGGNSITVSGNSNTLKFSVGAYLTTAALSGDSSKYAGTGFTSAGANIGLSGTHNTAGLSLSATVAAQSNQSAIKAFGVSNTGATAGNTGVSTGIDWVLAGSSPLSLSQSTAVGGPNTVWIQPAAWLTTADLSANSSKYAQEWALTGNTAGTTSSAQGTRWFLSGGANLTISGNSNTLVFSAGSAAPSPVNFSAGTTSSDLGSVVFSNSNGVSFGLSGSTITGTVSTYSTVGTATTGAAVGSANSVGTITRWVAEDHVHAGIGAIGISTAGNTSGTTGTVQGTYWFQGGNAITVSQITSNNGSHTLVFSGANVVRNFEPYRQTNTVGFALGAGTWYLAPFIAPGAISGGRINILAVNTSTAGIARDVTAASFNSNTSGTKQQGYTFSLGAALFSQGTGANSTRLESFWSNNFSFGITGKVIVSVTGGNNSVSAYNSWSLSYISDIGSDGAYTLNQFASNSSTGATNTSQDITALNSVALSIRNVLSNSVVLPIGLNTTIQEGEYWLGLAWSSTASSAVTNFGGTGGASALMFSHLSIIGISNLELNSAYRNWGSTATTARSQIFLGEGAMYTGAANMAPPSAIAISSDLSSLASQWIPYFNIQYRGLTK